MNNVTTFTDILSSFEDTNNMDFCEDFSQLQTTFNYVNDLVKPLKKILFRGGNEPYIDEIIRRLQYLFCTKNYSDADHVLNLENEKPIRKIALFLILNADIDVKSHLLPEDNNVSHLLRTLPAIPQCVLMSCLIELKLSKYLGEFIQYAPTPLVVLYLQHAVESILKQGTQIDVVNVFNGIYSHILRTNCRDEGVLSKISEDAVELLRCWFNPNDEDKLKSMAVPKKQEHLGLYVKDLLELILHCFELHQTLSFECSEAHQIYSFGRNLNEDNGRNETIALYNLNQLMLDVLSTNIENVSLNDFIYWVEIDLDEDTTLQSANGNLVYRLIDFVKTNEKFKHDVILKMQPLAIKPLSLIEKVLNARMGQVLTKLDNPKLEHRELWISQLLRQDELLYENDECFETLVQNVSHLNEQHVQTLMEFVRKKNNASPTDDKDTMEECEPRDIVALVIESLNNFNANEINSLSLYQLKLFGVYSNEFLTFEFNERTNEYFNKLTKDGSINEQQMSSLIFQHPVGFVAEVVEQSLKSDEQMVLCCKILEVSSKVTNSFVLNELISLLNNNFAKWTAKERLRMSKLFSTIYTMEILPKAEFFKNFLSKEAAKALHNQNYDLLAVLLESMLVISRQSRFCEGIAPVLILGGQIMDDCRWDAMSFTAEKEQIVRHAIEFVGNVMKKFLPNATEKDKQWANQRSAGFKAITKYYFQKLSLKEDEPILDFDIFLQKELKIENSKIGSAFVCEILVRCTSKEAKWLAKNQKLHRHFAPTMIMLSMVVSKSTERAPFEFFRNCFRNYVKIFQEDIIPAMEGNEDEYCKMQIAILEKLPPSNYAECFLNIQPSLLQLISTKSSKDQLQEYLLLIEKLPECEAKTILLDNVSSITTV